jgi:hypothetical protein
MILPLFADAEVKNYLRDCIKKILDNAQIMNALPGYLLFDGADERMEIIIDKMNSIK